VPDSTIISIGKIQGLAPRELFQDVSQLLCSKSRVAPLKTLTVLKLELCGAEHLSRLIAEVAGTSAFEGKVYCWSDSAVALSWIRDEPSRFNIFVANRVAAIQELTESVDFFIKKFFFLI